MSHQATCSWDGTHQGGEGKVELSFLRPLLELCLDRVSAQALAPLLLPAGLRPHEIHFDNFWLLADDAETLLAGLVPLVGGEEGLKALRLDASAAGFIPIHGGAPGAPAEALFGLLCRLLPGTQLQTLEQGLLGFRARLKPTFRPSRLFQAYCAALMRAILRLSAGSLSRLRVQGHGDHGCVVQVWGLGLGRLRLALPLARVWQRLRGSKRLRLQVQQQQRQLGYHHRQLQAMQRIQDLLAEGTLDGLALYDGGGRLVFASRRMAELLGVTPRQAALGGLEEALRPYWQAGQGLAHSGGMDLELPQVGLARLQVDEVPEPPGSAGARLLRLRAMGPEELQRAQAVAKAELMAALLDHGQEAVLILDPEAGIRYATPNLKRLFGHRTRSLLGEGLESLFDADDARAVAAMLRELRVGAGVSLRLRLRHGSGGWRWVMATVEDRRTVPEIGGFLLQLRDVTPLMEFEAAMRETEDSLRRSEAFYRMIIEGATDLVILLDLQHRVLYANPAVRPALGYSPAALVGKDVFDYLAPEDLPAAVEAMAQALRQRWAAARVRAAHKEGGHRLFEAHVRYTRDSDGRQVFVVAARDVTHEDELERQALQESRLEAMGRLAGGVAHDFNNLLTVIQGNAELALARPQESAAAHLREIFDASQRAGELVQQLLTLGRRQSLQVRALDLGLLLREHSGFLRRMLGESVQMRLQLPAEPMVVRAEPLSLTRALLNLAANARDAMPQGGVLSLACSVHRVEGVASQAHPDQAPGDYVRLDVTDTGTGMGPDVLARAFEPYFTTRPKGNGLGLPLVLGTVRQLGGFVRVRSAPGEGSVFSLFLPQAQAEELRAPGPAGGEAAARGLSKPGREACVLVVDDEEGIRRLAADSLRQAGLQVLEAGDGEEALEIWREARHHHQRVDLVLSDVVMPRMSGIELLQKIHEQDPRQPYLFMSGFYDSEQAKKAGYPIDLFKPFSVQVLSEKVFSTLDR